MGRKRKRKNKWRYFLPKMDPIPIKFFTEKPENPQVGDMWYCTRYLESEYACNEILSKEYFDTWAEHRPPLFIMLPGGTCFCIDSRSACDNEGWKIKGWPPFISLSPSVNIKGGNYHGFIRDGKII